LADYHVIKNLLPGFFRRRPVRVVVGVALLSHARDVHVGAGAKRLAAQATTEYHDRFLIELVQNAHDAHHPPKSPRS